MNLKNTKWMGIIILLSLLMTGISFGERGYDLDEFDDLELNSLYKQKKQVKNDNKQRLILYDDNLFLLDDEFDFGNDEIELQKLELNPDDMETAKEYEDFLNAFFENSTSLGTSSNSRSNDSKQKQPQKSRKDNNFNSKPSRKVAGGSGRSNKSSPPTTTFRPSRGALGFGVSTIIGATISVTKQGLSPGYNFCIRIDTPISFNLAGMEANVGTDINFSSMPAFEGGDKLKLTNIIGYFSLFPFSSIEIRTGLGFTPEVNGDYIQISALSIPVDVNYYLPMNFAGFKFALNLHAQRTLGYPYKEWVKGVNSTDFLYLGFLIQLHQQPF
mgnify:CR=1 FL=1